MQVCESTPEVGQKPSLGTLTVQGTGLYPLEHNGQRVVTLAMVDKVHRNPHEYARRNFNRNRSRFQESKVYFKTSILAYRLGFRGNSGNKEPRPKVSAEPARLTPEQEWQIPRAGRSLTLLTERGYYKLKQLHYDSSVKQTDTPQDVDSKAGFPAAH